MSHFIQDNQAVVKTNDGVYLLFIKGGDNNVFDHNNRRCSDWFFNRGFANKEAFNAFLDAMITDVSSGGWQFQSLKNKELHGYYDYEAIVIERFRKAFKNAIPVDFDMKELDTTNVMAFIEKIVAALKAKSFVGVDEIKYSLTRLWSDDREKGLTEEMVAVERLNRTWTKEPTTKLGRCNFYLEYQGKTLEELVLDSDFCRRVQENGFYPSNYYGAFNMLEGIKNFSLAEKMPYENLKMLMLNEASVEQFLISLFRGYYPNGLLPLLPLWERFYNDSDFRQLADRLIEEKLSSEEDWIQKDGALFKEHLSTFSFDELRAKRQEYIDGANARFAEEWNDIVTDCWYTNTNETLTRTLRNLRADVNFLQLNDSFSKNIEELSFKTITQHHSRQKPKNQKAIEEMAYALCTEFRHIVALTCDVSWLEILIEYFKFDIKLPSKTATHKPHTQLSFDLSEVV